jgi:hypothetical protein
MKLLFIRILFIIALSLIGCRTDVEENDGSTSYEDLRVLNELFSEENWEQMETLFGTVEDELIRFVDYLEEYDLLEVLEGVGVNFPAIYNDEVIMSNNRARVTLLLRDEPEFFSIIKDINDRGIITEISITERPPDIWITFVINGEYTPFTTRIHGAPNFFRYIGEDGVAPARFRQVRKGWYAEISPPHGFH